MDRARPYELPRAKFDMVIATGRTFAKTPLQRIMASLAGSNHGNDSKDACLKLERTKVNILGGIFQLKEYDVLANKYYLDILKVDSHTNTDVILLRLFILGCQPIYDTFREVNMATGITSATWRVYFLPKSYPPQLMVNGSICDESLFDNKLHPAHGKNAPRSRKGCQASLKPCYKQAVEEIKKSDAKLLGGAQHGKSPAADNHLALIPRTPDDTLTISTFIGSNGNLSPPGGPNITSAPPPMLLLTNGGTVDGFIAVSNKEKRSRKDIDSTALLTSPVLQHLDGIATSNYFQSF
ncbi:hypothetical protein Plhal304r1_c073g0161221 [Plasmopara halstedii]